MKQIVSINKAFNIKILKQRENYRFKKIHITWGFRKDFDKYGNIEHLLNTSNIESGLKDFFTMPKNSIEGKNIKGFRRTKLFGQPRN